MLPKGGAVLIPLNSNEDELFIGAKNMGLAYPNDIVEAERYHAEWSNRKRSSESLERRNEGRIVAILERRTHRVVGTLKKRATTVS